MQRPVVGLRRVVVSAKKRCSRARGEGHIRARALGLLLDRVLPALLTARRQQIVGLFEDFSELAHARGLWLYWGQMQSVVVDVTLAVAALTGRTFRSNVARVTIVVEIFGLSCLLLLQLVIAVRIVAVPLVK